jgi:hypothetical protein
MARDPRSSQGTRKLISNPDLTCKQLFSFFFLFFINFFLLLFYKEDMFHLLLGRADNFDTTR